MTVPVIDMKQTGQRIAALRVRSGISVRSLQQMLGIATPQAIYKWQRGAAMPTLDNLVVLASVFGTTMDAIIVRRGAASKRAGT